MLELVFKYRSELQDRVIDTFGFSYFSYKPFWSSTQQDATTAWLLNANADSYTTSPKRELNTALPVIKLG